MLFKEKLEHALKISDSLLCVGLDSDAAKIPPYLLERRNPQYIFNREIINRIAKFVCAFKPNKAFYESRGPSGIEDLRMTFEYIQQYYPHVITILDAKYGDIGNTNEGYASFAFDYLKADAVTLNPYFGEEALKPFLEREDKGCIILCRTSNPGAKEFQDKQVDGMPFYLYVARQVVKKWNVRNNCMLVVGGTYPNELAQIRAIAADITFLVPGIGTQGGRVKEVVEAGLNSKRKGLIINSSSGIIFAAKGIGYAQRAGVEAKKLRDEINSYRVK